MVIERFDVVLASFDPAFGSEIRDVRPAVVLSPVEMNSHVRTVIVAPMTSARKPWPTRVDSEFQGRRGQIALDQMRAIDQGRIRRALGRLEQETAAALQQSLLELFA